MDGGGPVRSSSPVVWRPGDVEDVIEGSGFVVVRLHHCELPQYIHPEVGARIGLAAQRVLMAEAAGLAEEMPPTTWRAIIAAAFVLATMLVLMWQALWMRQ